MWDLTPWDFQRLVDAFDDHQDRDRKLHMLTGWTAIHCLALYQDKGLPNFERVFSDLTPVPGVKKGKPGHVVAAKLRAMFADIPVEDRRPKKGARSGN